MPRGIPNETPASAAVKALIREEIGAVDVKLDPKALAVLESKMSARVEAAVTAVYREVTLKLWKSCIAEANATPPSEAKSENSVAAATEPPPHPSKKKPTVN